MLQTQKNHQKIRLVKIPLGGFCIKLNTKLRLCLNNYTQNILEIKAICFLYKQESGLYNGC